MDENKDTERQSDKKVGMLSLLDSQTKKVIGIVTFGIVLFAALNNLGSIFGVVSFILSVAKPFTVGIVIAFLLNIPMRFVEKKLFGRFRHRRVMSILGTYLLTIAIVVLLVSSIIPQLFNSIMALYNSMPGYLDNLDDFLVNYFGAPADIMDTIYSTLSDYVASSGSWIRDTLPTLLMNAAQSIWAGFIFGITGIIASIYMLANKEKLLAQCNRILHAFASEKVTEKGTQVARLCNDVFSGFIGGKLLVSLILGVVCFIFMSVVNMIHGFTGIAWLQMPYALLISCVIGITNIIPYFGPVLGTVLTVIILLMVSPVSALIFLAFVIVLQQVDNNYVTPKLVGKTIGLPALWVFVGTIVGGSLSGITGMLMGVPLAAVLYIHGSGLIENRLKKKGLDETVPRVQP